MQQNINEIFGSNSNNRNDKKAIIAKRLETLKNDPKHQSSGKITKIAVVKNNCIAVNIDSKLNHINGALLTIFENKTTVMENLADCFQTLVNSDFQKTLLSYLNRFPQQLAIYKQLEKNGFTISENEK